MRRPPRRARSATTAVATLSLGRGCDVVGLRKKFYQSARRRARPLAPEDTMADDTTTSALALQPDFSAETPRPERAPLSGIEDPVPLFAQPDRRFATAQGIAGIEAVPGGARVEVATQDGRPAELLVQRTRSGALRLRWSCPPGAPGTVRDTDGMLAEGADPDPSAAVELCDGALTLDAPTWRFELEPDMSWTLRRPDGTQLTAQRRDDGAFSHWMSRPLGTSRGEGLRTWAHESLVLAPEERIYGLGQQYGPIDKRGMRIVQYNRDAIGSNGTLITYHNTPFCWSSAGYGLVGHAAGPARRLLRAVRPARHRAGLGAGHLDVAMHVQQPRRGGRGRPQPGGDRLPARRRPPRPALDAGAPHPRQRPRRRPHLGRRAVRRPAQLLRDDARRGASSCQSLGEPLRA